MEKLTICYHGTTEKNASLIEKVGFIAWTYFAKHLEDAVEFGGNHIFEVMFKKSEIPDNWQFRLPKHIPSKNIVRHYEFNKTVINDNTSLRKKIFNSNQ